MAKTLLPPGFRFHPTDVELVKYYLKRKVMGKTLHFEAIAELDIYKFAPWDLPDKSCLRSRDLKWYFFCQRERKYANGARTNRATEFGYWKTTGKDRPILYNKQTVGMIKTLVFHEGRAPRGVRTDWVMHEYRLDDKDLADVGVVQDAYVLCMIFQKSGPGPRNGAQYGAPFHEEDWNDDVEVNCAESSPFACMSTPALALPSNQNNSIVTSTMVPGASFNEEDWNDDVEVNWAESSPFTCLSTPALVLPNNQSSSIVTSAMVPGSTCSGSSLQLDPSKTVPSADGVLPPVPGSSCSWFSLELGPSKTVPSADWVLQPVADDDDIDSTLGFPDDDILSMFSMFTEDGTLLSIENDKNEKLNNLNHVGNVEAASCLDGHNIYNDLGDLGNLADLSGDGFNLSRDHNVVYTMNRMFPSDDISFLELTDLESPLKCLAEASGSEHFPIDGLLGPYDCYNNSEHFCHPDNPFGAVLNVSGLSQSCPLPAKGFYQFEDHLDVFQKENGGGENENQGCKAASYSVDVTRCERSELGSKRVPQAQKRGEQQRRFYSRFQHLLESIPARPASAAEHPAPTYGAKRSDRSTLLTPYGGSSIHKAEVTLRGGGRTKDALSNKSVEFQCICYGCNLSKREFGKEVSTCSSRFTFVFFLGMFSALMWIFIVAVVTKLGRYVWNLVIS